MNNTLDLLDPYSEIEIQTCYDAYVNTIRDAIFLEHGVEPDDIPVDVCLSGDKKISFWVPKRFEEYSHEERLEQFCKYFDNHPILRETLQNIPPKPDIKMDDYTVEELFAELDKMEQKGNVIQEFTEDLHIFKLLDEIGKMPEIHWYMEHGYASYEDYKNGHKTLTQECIKDLKKFLAERKQQVIQKNDETEEYDGVICESDGMVNRGKTIQELVLEILVSPVEPKIPYYMEQGYASYEDYRMGHKNLNPDFIPNLKEHWARRKEIISEAVLESLESPTIPMIPFYMEQGYASWEDWLLGRKAPVTT
jgi:hypothetical protein